MDSYARPNKQRTADVFRGRIPDRVPVFEVLVENPALEYILGRPPSVASTLAGLSPEEYVDFAQKTGQDVIGLNFYFTPFHTTDTAGREVLLTDRIRTREDLARLSHRVPDATEDTFALLDKYQKAVSGTDIGLFVLTGAFMTHAYDSLFGFEDFMYLLYDDLGLIEDVLELQTEYYVQVSKRLVDYDLTFFYVGDDVAFKSGTLFHPDLLRRIWLPRIARIMEPAVERDIPILFHSDGNIWELIPDLLDVGMDGLNPIEPYGMDIHEVKRRFGDTLTLVGNLDVGGVLSRGTPEEVRQEAGELIANIGKRGRYILASCHSITANVPPENYLAMVKTAQEQGRY